MKYLYLCYFFTLFSLFFLYQITLAQASQNYLPDPSFHPLLAKINQGAISSLIVQPNQKVLVNLNANYLNGKHARGPIRLNEDGSLDTTFLKPVEVEYASMMALRSDGKIIAAGIFGDYRYKFFRLHTDGSLDSAVQTTIKSEYSIGSPFALYKNKILIGCNNYEGNSFKGTIYRLNEDFSVDSTFNMNGLQCDWIGSIIVQSDGKIIATGSFNRQPNGSYESIARLNADGSRDNGFIPTAEVIHTNVSSVAVKSDGKILIGNTQLVQLNSDGSLDNTFQKLTLTSPNSFSGIVIQEDGKVVVSKWYAGNSNLTKGHNEIIRLNTDGTQDNLFNASKSEIVSTFTLPPLAVQADGDVLVGGYLSHPGELGPSNLIRLNGSDGSIDKTFNSRVEYDGIIQKIVRQTDGKLLLGGSFDTADDRPQSCLTRLNQDGTVDSTFKIGTGLDGNYDVNQGYIWEVALQADDKILIGGRFASFNGRKAYSLVRINPDGSTDSTFNTSWNGSCTVMAIIVQPDKKIVVSVDFGINSKKYLVRLNPDGTEDPTFDTGTGFNSGINHIVLQPDGKIVVSGSFTSVNGIAARHIVRLEANGAVDNTFTTAGTDGDINVLELQKDGRLLVGGIFTTFDNTPKNQLVRLNADGSLDNTFNTDLKANDQIRHCLLQPDGGMLVIGYLHAIYFQGIVRLKSNGTLDDHFYLMGLESYASLAVLQDNKLLVTNGSKLTRLALPLEQTITFPSIPDKLATDAPFTLSATSSSGLPVTFTVVAGPATVSGNTLTLTGMPGTVIIRVSQVGNAYYAAAPEVETTFQVNAVLGLEKLTETIKLYPNPASGAFTIELPYNLNQTKLQLFNAQGKEVSILVANAAGSLRVEAGHLPTGLYVLHLQAGNVQLSHKVVLK